MWGMLGRGEGGGGQSDTIVDGVPVIASREQVFFTVRKRRKIFC